MSKLKVQGEFLPGTDIKVACVEACALANRIHVIVEFQFNGVSCFASPGGSPESLEKEWLDALNPKSKYKMAFSR